MGRGDSGDNNCVNVGQGEDRVRGGVVCDSWEVFLNPFGSDGGRICDSDDFCSSDKLVELLDRKLLFCKSVV